jgi:tetratricopeptide (TPR) repeat protein
VLLSPEQSGYVADEIVRGQNTDIEKVRALYEWVSRNIRYVSLSFGVGRYQPHSAAEVLQNRYGDCKDKATLLEALFEAEGFHGVPVLINSKGDIDPDVPTPLQFDHAFTFLSLGGHDYWLDSTLGVGPFGYLLPQLRGEGALLAAGNGKSVLRKTPEDLPYTSLYQLDVDGSMDENKNLDVKLGLDTRSDLEVLLRIAFREMSRGQLTTVLQNMQKGAAEASKTTNNNIAFSDLKGSDPSDTRIPYHLEVRIQGNVPDTKKEGGDVSGKSREQSVEQLRSLLSFLLPPLRADVDSNGKAEPQAVKLEGGREFSLNVVFTSPDIQKPLADKPIHIDISKDFAEFRVDLTRDGQTVRGKILLNLRTREVPAGKSDDYAAFVEAVSDSFASMSAKSDAATPHSGASHSSSTTASDSQSLAHEMYNAGIKAFNNRDYKTARQQYEGAVEKDPKFGDAWNNLGRTYMNLGLLDKAVEAFQKAIAVAPGDKFAYNNLGIVLRRQQKYDEAIRAYQKQIEISPQDRFAHSNLARLYLDLEKYDPAERELDKASSIVGDNADISLLLGQAQLGLNQPDKARQSFDRALELSATAAMFNGVAYEMSLKKFDLDRAQNYAESAISSTSALLRNVSIANPSMTDVSHTAVLAAYWDTLGWIKFQQSDLKPAETYVMSAWMLCEHGEVADHLAQIYEKEGRTPEAIHQYELALATSYPVPATRPRLAALLGPDQKIDALVSKAGAELPSRRTMKLANRTNEEGQAEFSLLFIPDEKPPSVRFISGADKLRNFTDAIQAVKFPSMFPDSAETRLLRRGTLSCRHADAECTFVLIPAEEIHSVE